MTRALSRTVRSTFVLALAAALLLITPSSNAATGSGPSQGFVIQGVPNATVQVVLDGKTVSSGMTAKQVSGPIALSRGHHSITFKSSKWTITSGFGVTERSLDIVVHWPADSTAKPVVTVFKNVVSPVPTGKGRITVAHTAVVPPADIRVNGKVLFSNIANGEFVTAEVPAATYSVEVVPTGGTKPLLGPVDLPVKAGVLTRVFAIGEPKNGSMDAVVQVIDLPQSSMNAPSSMGAGSAGLVATRVVGQHEEQGLPPLGWLVVTVLLGGIGAGSLLSRRRHVHRHG